MASVSESPGRPAARVVTAVILALIAIVLVIVGVIYLAEPSRSLPSVLPGHLAATAAASGKNHPLQRRRLPGAGRHLLRRGLVRALVPAQGRRLRRLPAELPAGRH